MNISKINSKKNKLTEIQFFQNVISQMHILSNRIKFLSCIKNFNNSFQVKE